MGLKLSFSFHLLWFNLVFYYRYNVTFLHVYFAMAHSFSRRTRVLFLPYREVLDSGIISSASCCWLSAAWSPESFSSKELLVDPTMHSTLSEMSQIFVFERQISHAKQINLSVKITNSNARYSEKEARVLSLRYFMFKTFIILKYFHIQTSGIYKT